MANLKNTNIDNNLELPSGTTGERPASPQEGQIRYNTDLGVTEFYNGANWRPLSDTHPEATGGTVVDTEIGGVPYRIHYFTETGTDTFTVTNPGEVDVLIVAGGGSAGSQHNTNTSGGGGGGGVVLQKIQLSSGSYPVVVGAGGSGTTDSSGQAGENSSFLSVVALGGGRGAGTGDGGDGGSGGGGSSFGSGTGGVGLQPTSVSGGFGNNGGGALTGQGGGGGGGAGNAGENTDSDKGGNGGTGIFVEPDFVGVGESGWVAGGSGGTGISNNPAGKRGLGGSGISIKENDSWNASIVDAQPNTGGAGGGAKRPHPRGGNGGSGIVIVRYPRNSSLDSEPDETRPSFQPYNYARDVRPIISRTGLVLELDAANPLSYPGTGTTWTDLSSNGNNGTLINSVDFTNQNFGSLTFNGSNTAIHTTQQVSNAFTGNNSVSFWIYADSNILTRNCILYARGNSTTLDTGGSSDSSATNENVNLQVKDFDILIYLPKVGGGTNNVLSIPSPIFDNWSFITVQWEKGRGLVEGYINGILEASTTSAIFNFSAFRNSANSITVIGNNGGDQAFNGKIAKVLIYNRTLSLQEIRQNFNATRGRYGI